MLTHSFHNNFPNLLTTLLDLYFFFFFFNDTATTEIYTLSLHDALPICLCGAWASDGEWPSTPRRVPAFLCRGPAARTAGRPPLAVRAGPLHRNAGTLREIGRAHV